MGGRGRKRGMRREVGCGEREIRMKARQRDKMEDRKSL